MRSTIKIGAYERGVSDKQARDTFAEVSNKKICESLLEAWRTNKRTLVKQVINNCSSLRLAGLWKNGTSMLMTPEEAKEFNAYMGEII